MRPDLPYWGSRRSISRFLVQRPRFDADYSLGMQNLQFSAKAPFFSTRGVEAIRRRDPDGSTRDSHFCQPLVTFSFRQFAVVVISLRDTAAASFRTHAAAAANLHCQNQRQEESFRPFGERRL